MQALLTSRSTPHVLVQPLSSMGDAPCMWNTSGVKLHGIFSQWDLSIWQVSEYMSRMCACLRRLRYCTNEYSPEGNCCRKSTVQYDTTPKYPVFVLRAPEKGDNHVQVPRYSTHNWQKIGIPFVWYVSNMGTRALASLCILSGGGASLAGDLVLGHIFDFSFSADGANYY